MQRDSFVLPNTFRDSNEISLTRPSAPSIDDMDFDSESRHSIIRPVEPDHSLPPRFDPSNSNPIINKPLSRSIVRSHPNIDDDDDEEAAAHEQTSNERLINENDNALLEAAGYDSNRLAEVDADAAYALQLQQEEYSRDSLAANRQRFLPFQVEPDEESNPSISVGLDPSQFGSDAEYATYLQEQENRNRSRYRPPFPFFPIQQRSQPGSIQTSETDEGDNDPNALVRFSSRRPPFHEDDDDDDDVSPQSASAQAFLQFLANSGHPMREGFPAFLRRGRRTGNLQDTEEDFGPEDYERLLQLDDGIHKKKLSQHQINSIPETKFHARANNTDEENKCGVCLELFEENQTLRQFPCQHVYHKECGDRWLKENNVCPICRKIPVQTQSTSHSRHHPHHQPRGTGGPRRPVISNRNPSNQPNNNNNNNNNSSNSNNNHRRRPPASHHQS